MRKADFAAYLFPARQQVSDRAIRHGWECCDPDPRPLEAQLRRQLGSEGRAVVCWRGEPLDFGPESAFKAMPSCP